MQTKEKKDKETGPMKTKKKKKHCHFKAINLDETNQRSSLTDELNGVNLGFIDENGKRLFVHLYLWELGLFHGELGHIHEDRLCERIYPL